MGRLNQVIAVAATKKANSKKALERAYHLFDKPDLFLGHTKAYQPKEEEGDVLPPENKKVQHTVDGLLGEIREPFVECLDVILTQDKANTEAKADVVVDGVKIVSQVPVTFLLCLEKELTNLQAFFSRVPTLDSTDNWKYDRNSDLFMSDAVRTTRTQKVQEPLVLYAATPEHPAQTQLITRDVVAGHWTSQKFSGGWSARRKNIVLEKIRKLKEAVVTAREEANSLTVTQVEVGAAILDFILEGGEST